MDKVYLSKHEKRALRLALKQFHGMPNDIPQDKYCSAVRSLQRKGLVEALYRETGGIIMVWLTEGGEDYICENPNLTNPIPWAKVGAILGAITSVATIAGVIMAIIACTHFINI